MRVCARACVRVCVEFVTLCDRLFESLKMFVASRRLLVEPQGLIQLGLECHDCSAAR